MKEELLKRIDKRMADMNILSGGSAEFFYMIKELEWVKSQIEELSKQDTIEHNGRHSVMTDKHHVECPSCKGSGSYEHNVIDEYVVHDCDDCKGTGRIPKPKKTSLEELHKEMDEDYEKNREWLNRLGEDKPRLKEGE